MWCQDCGEYIEDGGYLCRRKARFHGNPDIYCCDLCDCTCYGEGSLERHKITMHCETAGYKCEICRYYIGHRSDLKKHWKIFHRGRPKIQSKGEVAVEEALMKNLNHRKYILSSEKIFGDLKSPKGNYLMYDFVVSSIETRKVCLLIEFYGEQHYEPVKWLNLTKEGAILKHKEIVRNDRIKEKYAEDHGCDLLRIPYDQLDKVEEMVVDFMSRYGVL